MITIKLTKKQITDLTSMLFVGGIDFKDKKNKEICKELHSIIQEQYFKEIGE